MLRPLTLRPCLDASAVRDDKLQWLAVYSTSISSYVQVVHKAMEDDSLHG